jgi:cell division septation protein DedD
MQRLARMWAKRAIVAAACFMAFNVALFGASHLSNRLVAMMTEPELVPAPPAAPTLPIPELSLPVPAASGATTPAAASTPASPSSSEIPRPAAAPPAPLSVGDHFVAVGLFASRERSDRLVQNLTVAGFPAQQRPYPFRQRIVQQVLLGPFVTRREATTSLARLREIGGFDDANVVVIAAAPR